MPKNILYDRQEIKKIDKSNTLASIEALADQIKQAWEESQKIDFKAKKDIKNIVVVGMGGSGLGADVVKHLFKEELIVPLEVVNSYTLPEYADENTLVVLSSYSGNTEEVLSAAQQTAAKKAQMMVITSGGKLLDLAKKEQLPYYHIIPKYDPSGTPRLAVGYAIFGLIGMLQKASMLKISKETLTEISTTIIDQVEKCKPEIEDDHNPAKMLAFKFFDRRPVLVVSEFLSGVVHISANQFNENAKSFADYKIIPEINHHLMEGLKFPSSNALSHLFVFINSKLYHPRNQKRHQLTQQVVEQNNLETLKIDLYSETKITQAFELLTLLSFASFYLAILEKVDPKPNPYVDWFKKELNK